jgi:hypothetical protein
LYADLDVDEERRERKEASKPFKAMTWFKSLNKKFVYYKDYEEEGSLYLLTKCL